MTRQVEIFFDGDCPLCAKEVAFLARRDRHDRVQFTDIAAPTFDAGAYGRTQDDFMAKIHGRLADGQWIEGVDVFRHVYSAVGFGWAVAISKLPGVSHLLHLGYRWFARNRLRITGRCDAACAVPDTSSQRTAGGAA